MRNCVRIARPLENRTLETQEDIRDQNITVAEEDPIVPLDLEPQEAPR